MDQPAFIQAVSPLRLLVRDIWHLDAYNLQQQPKTFRVFADGLPGIMFHASHSGLTMNQEMLPSLFLYGQTIQPVEMAYSGELRVIIFYLYPYALKVLFGIDANELTDRCVDFDYIDKQLLQQLMDEGDARGQVDIISRYIVSLYNRKPAKTDNRVLHAVNEIMQAEGELSLTGLRNGLFMTERTFERKFLQTVGVSASAYAKICRFNAALRRIKEDTGKSLTDIAFETGYADQSHFIRHFREFTAMTPSQFKSIMHDQLLP